MIALTLKNGKPASMSAAERQGGAHAAQCPRKAGTEHSTTPRSPSGGSPKPAPFGRRCACRRARACPRRVHGLSTNQLVLAGTRRHSTDSTLAFGLLNPYGLVQDGTGRTDPVKLGVKRPEVQILSARPTKGRLTGVIRLAHPARSTGRRAAPVTALVVVSSLVSTLSSSRGASPPRPVGAAAPITTTPLGPDARRFVDLEHAHGAASSRTSVT